MPGAYLSGSYKIWQVDNVVQFYLDDLDNELNITALRMLVKDLLILFQACNEGVINVLGVFNLKMPVVQLE